MPPGSLTVVGLGIQAAGHVTAEARAAIEQAERVFLVLGDAASMAWVQALNPNAAWLPFHTGSDAAFDTYEAWQAQVDRWIERLLAGVREGSRVCVVLHGHPGVCVFPTHAAIRQARREGFPAQMLPGISAVDCLVADLGLNPCEHGWQSFDATDFLIRRRPFSTASALVLWQIGLIGAFAQTRGRVNRQGLRVLQEVLVDAYGAHHEGIVYEAAIYPIVEPVVRRTPLANLSEAPITDSSTLYLPPLTTAPIDPDMLDRLALPRARVRPEQEKR